MNRNGLLLILCQQWYFLYKLLWSSMLYWQTVVIIIRIFTKYRLMDSTLQYFIIWNHVNKPIRSCYTSGPCRPAERQRQTFNAMILILTVLWLPFSSEYFLQGFLFFTLVRWQEAGPIINGRQKKKKLLRTTNKKLFISLLLLYKNHFLQ